MPRNSDYQGRDKRYERVGEFVGIFNRNGVWYANYQYQGRQHRKSLRTRSKKEARRRALIIEKELLEGTHKRQRRALYIQDVVNRYLEHLKSEGRSRKTLGKYRFCFDLMLSIAEQNRITRITQLDIAFVDKFRAARAAGLGGRQGRHPKTVHNDTVLLRQLVNFALRRGMISDDPLAGLKIKKPPRTPQPCWNRDQVNRILDAASSPHREALVFLADTGTRISEAKWLTWDNVDLERRLVHIRAKEGWRTKSGNERVIPMTDRLYAMLVEMPRGSKWVFAARVTSRHPEPGRQISERRLLQYLKRILKPLGLRGHLHTFRHSFISFAAYRGVPERVLRKWIGHVDPEILAWYFHLADEQSQEAMRRLADTVERPNDTKSEDSKPAQSQHNQKGTENEDSAN